MKCPKCGVKNPEHEVFCLECGTDMAGFVRKTAPRVKCSKCGESNPPGESSCRKCFARLEPSFVLCPDCARENLVSSRWCVFCDAELPCAEPVAAPALEQPKAPEEKKQAIMCPKCGTPMEHGYMLVRTGGYSIRWSSEPDNFLGTMGVPIVGGDFWSGKLSMQGFRCRSCRVVTLRY